MTIPFSRIIKIDSSVGGASTIARRELSGLIVTTSPLAPLGSVLEFERAQDVANHFGASSETAKRAAFYFAYIDPNGGRPSKLLVGAFADSPRSPAVYGATAQARLTTLQQISAGSLLITVGNTGYNVNGVNLSEVTSFAGVATAIQTAVREANATVFATFTCTYDAVAQRFVLNLGTPGAGTMTVAGQQSDPNNLGYLMFVAAAQPGVINSRGSNQQTAAEALAAIVDASDNFGSLVFEKDLSLIDYTDAAKLNAGYGVTFMLMGRVTTAQVAEWGPACVGIASQALTHYDPANGQYPEMLPMCQMAATDYSKPNASVNYMFRNNSGSMLSPTVFSGNVATSYEAMRVNFIGETQNAGRKVAFYMPGLLGGGAQALVDMGVHANEQWLKAEATSDLGNLLINSGRVPANAAGRATIMATLQGVVQRALTNGVISVGKELTTLQRSFILQRTNDATAPIQVQSAGYWLDVVIRDEVDGSGNMRYYAAYVLIYSKDDAIRRIEGSHNLI